jgi:hypothetical protein
MGSNILIICVNIMFFLDVINIWHLGRRDFIIFITIKSWCDKIIIVRIILEVVVKLLPLPHPPRARPHGRTDKSKLPESHPTKECARACVRCL